MPRIANRLLGVGFQVGLMFCLGMSSGCGLLPSKPGVPAEAELRSLRQKQHGTPEGIIPSDLQAELMRYADHYGVMLLQAMNEFAQQLTTVDERARAQQFRVEQASAAVFVASGSQAHVSLLDMVVLVTLGRHLLESSWTNAAPATVQRLLESYQRLETNAWAVAARHLRKEQLEELRALIQEWHQQHRELQSVSFVRFAHVAQEFGYGPERKPTGPGSVLGVPHLDPLAGLDAVTRVTEQTRLLSERAMYWAQRLPVVTQWRTELLAAHLAQTPELRQVFSLSEALTNILAQTPALIAKERTAAIQQVFRELGRQQTNLMAHLAVQEEQVGGFLTNVQNVLGTGAEAATAAQRLVDSTRGLLTQTPLKEMSGGLTNGRPFDIQEYGAVITQVNTSAREFNALLQSADDTLPKVLNQTVSSGEVFANHLFKLGLAFGALFLVGLVGALLLYRLLVRKMFRMA